MLETQVELHLCLYISMRVQSVNFANMSLLVGNWNIRSLVKSSGDAHICQPGHDDHMDESSDHVVW